jgi:hypothetical protein
LGGDVISGFEESGKVWANKQTFDDGASAYCRKIVMFATGQGAKNYKIQAIKLSFLVSNFQI